MFKKTQMKTSKQKKKKSTPQKLPIKKKKPNKRCLYFKA